MSRGLLVDPKKRPVALLVEQRVPVEKPCIRQ